MKWFFFSCLCFIVQFTCAQKAEGVKVISADSLKKYHIGVAKDLRKVYIDKRGVVYSEDMSIWEKTKYFAMLIYERYPILSWSFIILIGLWVIGQIGKLIGNMAH